MKEEIKKINIQDEIPEKNESSSIKGKQVSPRQQ